MDVRPRIGGRQKSMCGCPPSFARSQKAGNGTPDILLYRYLYMKSKLKRIIIVMFLLSAVSVIAAEIKSHINDRKDKKNKEEIATQTDLQDVDMDNYYSYADIKSDVSFLADSVTEEESISRLVDALNESKPVDAGYIRSVCGIIGADESVYSQELGGAKDESYVTKEQFDNIYSNIEKSGCVENLERYDVYLFEIEETVEDDKSYKRVFDGYNTYVFDIEIPEQYYNKIIDVYAKDGHVYKINGYGNSNITLENVWIKSVDNGTCVFIYDGFEKSYGIDIGMQVDENCVASVTLDNIGIQSVEVLDDIFYEKVVKIDGDYLNLENGRIKMADNFMIYNAYNDVTFEANPFILTGYKEVAIIKKDELAIAAVIDEDLINYDIRVILSNDDYSSYNMENVIFTCEGSYIVTYPDETETLYEGGAEVNIDFADYEEGDVILVSPVENDSITVLSLNREYGNPSYYGDLEVNIYDEYLNLINIVPMETYLYSVVSSEMPTGGYSEALKAVAVCSRAYAFIKLNDGSFADYNANLDDSSLCQLYNASELNDDCIQAVKDTYGIVPAYKDSVITPFTYSTSYGVSSSNDEIWGGTSYGYYISRVDNVEKTTIDLSDEEAFKSFLEDSMGYDTIDKDMPYYRWHIDYTFEEMNDAIDMMLEERVSISSDNIKIQAGEDSFVDGEVDDLGDILDIRVAERTKSGVVSALIIEGSEKTIKVTGSSNIRNIITPVNQQIIKQDDSVITGWTSLPSPYYYIEKTSTGYTVYGGGFGYGVGMSINGAANLAKEGYNYKYIIHHYFTYAKFVPIYENIDNEDTEVEE